MFHSDISFLTLYRTKTRKKIQTRFLQYRNRFLLRNIKKDSRNDWEESEEEEEAAETVESEWGEEEKADD